MKNLLEIAKIFVLAAVIIIPANCQANYYSVPITHLKDIIGNWYDTKGNLVLTIGSDYSINGCKILASYYDSDFTSYFGCGCHCYEIIENRGKRNIHLEHFGENYHEMIVVDGKNTFRRTKNLQYFESVGGIYIGMSKSEVLKLYGAPSNVEGNKWNYNSEKFQVRFAGNVVTGITIYKGGNRKFDRTGLSCNDLKSTFKNKYNADYGYSMIGRDESILVIGYGEQIEFNYNSVSLAIQAGY